MIKKLMAANWKMYKLWQEAGVTARELVSLLGNNLPQDREVLIIPPFTSLKTVSDALADAPGFQLGGQNFYPAEQGAYTGEIAPEMLTDLGCTYALAGHSERRHVMGEDNETVGRKVLFGLQSGLRMILCVGETIEQRKKDLVEAVLEEQLRAGLSGVDQAVDAAQIAVAYEPVWAIGTGEVAGPDEIVAAHGFVREQLNNVLPAIGAQVRILYGGSVKPDNCSQIINLDNVDGVLVGGASLNADSFKDIVLASA